jgi:hypothetical protein
MGMSSRIRAFIPPDQKWEKMKAVYDACTFANLSVPPEVSKFFDYKAPDPAGVEIKIPYSETSDSDSCSDIFEVKVSDIPENATVIRFTNSY